MIKYQLICDLSHEFEGWFQTSAAFDVQNQSELITCPVCGSANVRRALMTPNLASPKRRRKPSVDNISNTNASIVGINGAPSSLPSRSNKSVEDRVMLRLMLCLVRLKLVRRWPNCASFSVRSRLNTVTSELNLLQRRGKFIMVKARLKISMASQVMRNGRH